MHRIVTSVVIAVSALSCTLAAGQPAQARQVRPTTTARAVVALSSYEHKVLVLVNRKRAAAHPKCRPLTMQAQLRKAARGHSVDMARRHYFSHTSLNGRTYRDRIEAAGYRRWTMLAENIAAGQRTPAQVMNGWMHSTEHRRNILNCRFTQIGVGAARAGNGMIYWTQDFARR